MCLSEKKNNSKQEKAGVRRVWGASVTSCRGCCGLGMYTYMALPYQWAAAVG